jgi:hypothetical protein
MWAIGIENGRFLGLAFGVLITDLWYDLLRSESISLCARIAVLQIEMVSFML